MLICHHWSERMYRLALFTKYQPINIGLIYSEPSDHSHQYQQSERQVYQIGGCVKGIICNICIYFMILFCKESIKNVLLIFCIEPS
jgi:hypothetical protein